MSKKMASIVVAYGVLLAALGAIIQWADPVSAQVTFSTGIVGAVGAPLCILCGVVALTGQRRRGWSIAAVGIIGFVLRKAQDEDD